MHHITTMGPVRRSRGMRFEHRSGNRTVGGGGGGGGGGAPGVPDLGVNANPQRQRDVPGRQSVEYPR
jgi:hypothetical protein